MTHRTRLLAFLLVLILPTLLITAQEPSPTPAPITAPEVGPLVLATNTPRPADAVLSYPRLPDDFRFYALRLWTPNAIASLLESQLNTVISTPTERNILAAQITTNEAVVRFPTIFERAEVQERLIPLLLAAPRGTVNMRPIAGPYVVRLINESGAIINPNQTTSLTVGAFDVTLQPVNASPLGTNDLVMSITTPVGATGDVVIFESHQFVRETDGRFNILPAAPAYPTAPLANVTDLELLRVGDLNRDGVDEFAVAVTYADRVNREMFIYGVRAGQGVRLTRPDARIRFQSIASWPTGENRLTVVNGRGQDTFWSCVEEQTITWTWGANVFVPQTPATGYAPGGGTACQLDALGNVFGVPPAEGVSGINRVISSATPTEADLAQRAALVTATLYLLDGRPAAAVEAAAGVRETAPTGSDRTRQADALLAAIGRPDLSPLQVCGIMAETAPDPVCDVEAVVLRLLTDAPLTAGEDITSQLAARNIPVLQTFTLVEVGRFDRPAAGLDLGDTVWLAFSPSPFDENLLLPTPIDPPDEFVVVEPPVRIVQLPDAVLNSYLIDRDYGSVVAAIESLQAADTTDALTERARYVLALAYEFTGNRTAARQTFYDLWATAPDTVWGRLAARHLERRS